MPLAFESESHGTIAFGFFNIESDLLILDQYFFFANDFCKLICDSANRDSKPNSEHLLPAYIIEDNTDIGDLHGAIAGTFYSGFIGDTYKTFPFPEDITGFKQQTDGYKTRLIFEKMLLNYGTTTELVLHKNLKHKQMAIGSIVFSEENFFSLIDYVIRGGYPQWLNNIAPDYVLKMKQALT